MIKTNVKYEIRWMGIKNYKKEEPLFELDIKPNEIIKSTYIVLTNGEHIYYLWNDFNKHVKTYEAEESLKKRIHTYFFVDNEMKVHFVTDEVIPRKNFLQMFIYKILGYYYRSFF
jgi:hypothetical protein